ncbi:hypothetical protein DM02DRAFT_617970 [Periconia macrospinosa]|uniref:Uncharacterized protein n=1 Tax=Periconia macrospinosa TaxID=97972 RepID=A0A2V1DDX1_9PLEO|nr:hypothetical protein DM02DRAFT_617970 [Periconia macrospinosa]
MYSIVVITALLSSVTALPSLEIVEKRGATDTYGDYTGQWSTYKDGEGKYVRSDDVHRYASGDKCWTDLFYVSSEVKQTDWEKKTTIDCASTSECETGLNDGVQSCNEWSIAISVGAEVGIIKDILSVSTEITTTYGESTCEMMGTTATCKWDDKKCHSVWASQEVTVNKGYIRRRCNFLNDREGDKTVWSKNWEVQMKASNSDAIHLGCGASCSATKYVL